MLFCLRFSPRTVENDRDKTIWIFKYSVNVCKNQQFKINVQLLYKYTFFLLLTSSWIRTLVAVVIVGPGVVVVAKNTVILIKMFVSELSQGKPDVTYPDVHFLPTVCDICAFFSEDIELVSHYCTLTQKKFQ